jgi:hypothetical protein
MPEPLAEKARDWQRPLGSDPRDEAAPPEVTAETVAEDTLVERPDLGPGATTLVTEGSTIPPELADYPRHSRDPKSKRGKG